MNTLSSYQMSSINRAFNIAGAGNMHRAKVLNSRTTP